MSSVSTALWSRSIDSAVDHQVLESIFVVQVHQRDASSNLLWGVSVLSAVVVKLLGWVVVELVVSIIELTSWLPVEQVSSVISLNPLSVCSWSSWLWVEIVLGWSSGNGSTEITYSVPSSCGFTNIFDISDSLESLLGRSFMAA